MKIRLTRAKLHANGRTDRQTNIKKLIVHFYNLANAPKTEKHEQELYIE
jgi:hypothetical protein